MFVDSVDITVKAGDGGAGIVSFRHEKYVEKGGPDGGDGGKGGNVIFVARENQHTLASFRYKKTIKAEDGKSGGKRKKRGASGADKLVEVPIGTTIFEVNTKDILADITTLDEPVVIAKGGSGGFGNAHFTSSTRQAPKVAEKGEPGQELSLGLELKMIADVGLVGLPNAGKSSLLSVISNAKPEVGEYAFTTVRPYLGVVDVEGAPSFLCADIPGLIDGASKGKGLGDDFLRHVERTAVLLHLIDAYNDDVIVAYKTIQKELADYVVDLTQKPQIVAVTKIEGLDNEMRNDVIAALKSVLPPHTPLMCISSQSKEGVKELLQKIVTIINIQRKAEAQKRELESSQVRSSDVPVISLPASDEGWSVKIRDDGVYVVYGKKIERFAKKTDFSNPHSVDRLYDILQKMGIVHELVRQGASPGDVIQIDGTEATLSV